MIEFLSDKVKVNGAKVDGSYTVTFEVGEYEQDKVAELLRIKQGTLIKVVVDESEQT